MMAGPTIEIDAPTRKPRAGGIKAVAEFRSNDRLGAAEDVTFQSPGCAFPAVDEHHCYTGEDTPDDKTFGGIDLVDAAVAPFPLYAGVSCYLRMQPDDAARAEAALLAGEDRGLEEALHTWAGGGTALTGGGSITGAVALVEQSLDAGYPGQGVIMMSRSDAVRADAAGVIKNEGGVLMTANGTPVLASGKVTQGTVFGLGAITVERSSTVVSETEDLAHNKHYALAEAVYAIAVDCAFRVKSATS